uniref:Uncharacterized protein n=1 Tax=Trichuris muris TaxID=70415 RepID=A0A5S6QK46_TRIMR
MWSLDGAEAFYEKRDPTFSGTGRRDGGSQGKSSNFSGMKPANCQTGTSRAQSGARSRRSFPPLSRDLRKAKLDGHFILRIGNAADGASDVPAVSALVPTRLSVIQLGLTP